jgi:hypothetical protein
MVQEKSCRLGNQIVIGVTDDFDPGELANRQFAADKNPTVNIRSIRLAAANQVIPCAG